MDRIVVRGNGPLRGAAEVSGSKNSALALMAAALLAPGESRLTNVPRLQDVNAMLELLAALGAIATSGHMLIVHAIRRVGASLVAPFQYLEIISATLLGLIFFGEFPDKTTWLGVAIIVGSGLYVFVRERRLAGAEDALAVQPVK